MPGSRARGMEQLRNYGVLASAHKDPAPASGRPRPPAARQSSNSVATWVPEAAREAAPGAATLWSPARASCMAASPWRTTASQPALRARAATRPASRPRPAATAAPSTSPHAAPQVGLARQARSTRAPPGGGVTASGFPVPPSPTTAWADIPHGPSHIRTDPAPARHDSCIPRTTGCRRRSGAGSPRAPAAARWSSAVAAGMGTSPGSDGPTSRRDRVPVTFPAKLSAPRPPRIPAAASTSAMTSARSASQLTLPGALSSTTAWTAAFHRAPDGLGRWGAAARPRWVSPSWEVDPSGPGSRGRSTASATSTAQEGKVAGPVTR